MPAGPFRYTCVLPKLLRTVSVRLVLAKRLFELDRTIARGGRLSEARLMGRPVSQRRIAES